MGDFMLFLAFFNLGAMVALSVFGIIFWRIIRDARKALNDMNNIDLPVHAAKPGIYHFTEAHDDRAVERKLE